MMVRGLGLNGAWGSDTFVVWEVRYLTSLKVLDTGFLPGLWSRSMMSRNFRLRSKDPWLYLACREMPANGTAYDNTFVSSCRLVVVVVVWRASWLLT